MLSEQLYMQTLITAVMLEGRPVLRECRGALESKEPSGLCPQRTGSHRSNSEHTERHGGNSHGSPGSH